MFATLIAVLLALAAGHIAPVLTAQLRDYSWFARWLRWLDARLAGTASWQGYLGVAVALLPLLALAAVQIACGDRLHGLPALLLGIAVLFYTWGPRDLDLDVAAVLDAGDIASRRAAAIHLWPPGKQVSLSVDPLVEAVFRGALRRWFGVLLWFLLLGPVGALLYRLTALVAEGINSHLLPPDHLVGARRLLAALDWPAAQLMTLAMALAGHFDGVIDAWRRHGGASFSADANYLAAAALACVRRERVRDLEDGIDDGALPESRDAMRLVWRILLLWIAVLALFVVAGWVG